MDTCGSVAVLPHTDFCTKSAKFIYNLAPAPYGVFGARLLFFLNKFLKVRFSTTGNT